MNFLRSNSVMLSLAVTVGLSVCMILAPPLTAQDNKEAEAKEKFNEGVEAAQNGKMDEAMKAYEAAIAADSSFADPYLNLGVIYFERDEYKKARTLFKKYTELNPESYDGFRSLGYTCIKLKDIQTGKTAFEGGLKLAPKDTDLLEGYAQLYFEADKWGPAIDRFNAYLQVNPKDKRALNDLAKSYYEAGRKNDAIATYDKALKIDPQYQMAHFQLGSLYLAEKEWEKAAKEFEKSSSLNKKHWQSFYNLGIARQALETQEDYLEAYRAYMQFLKLTKGMGGKSISNMRSQAENITKQLRDYFDEQGLDYEE